MRSASAEVDSSAQRPPSARVPIWRGGRRSSSSGRVRAVARRPGSAGEADGGARAAPRAVPTLGRAWRARARRSGCCCLVRRCIPSDRSHSQAARAAAASGSPRTPTRASSARRAAASAFAFSMHFPQLGARVGERGSGGAPRPRAAIASACAARARCHSLLREGVAPRLLPLSCASRDAARGARPPPPPPRGRHARRRRQLRARPHLVALPPIRASIATPLLAFIRAGEAIQVPRSSPPRSPPTWRLLRHDGVLRRAGCREHPVRRGEEQTGSEVG